MLPISGLYIIKVQSWLEFEQFGDEPGQRDPTVHTKRGEGDAVLSSRRHDPAAVPPGEGDSVREFPGEGIAVRTVRIARCET